MKSCREKGSCHHISLDVHFVAKTKVLIMARSAQFTSHFFCTLIVLGAAAGFVGCDSKVMESTRYYTCCNPEIGFDQDCEHTWEINKMTFAYFDKHSNKCAPPCKKIEDGVMTLDECAAVTDKTVHTDGTIVTREERIHFVPEPCPSPVPAEGNQVAGSIILMLLILMTVFIKL